jgi:DNA (cytosine-5)-methyltransferase 1
MNKATRHPERRYFDMKLWQEIIFLKHFFKGQWVVENVIPYYEPFITPTAELQRHLFWSNFKIFGKLEIDNVTNFIQTEDISAFEKYLGIDVNWKININGHNRTAQILRNCVHPELGLYILEQAQGIMRQEKTTQLGLFNIHSML